VGPVAQVGGFRHGKQRGKCRECREEQADGNTAGQQADDAEEHVQSFSRQQGGQRQRVSAPQRGRITAKGAGARTAEAPASASITA
jgi:hypothetical protein